MRLQLKYLDIKKVIQEKFKLFFHLPDSYELISFDVLYFDETTLKIYGLAEPKLHDPDKY